MDNIIRYIRACETAAEFDHEALKLRQQEDKLVDRGSAELGPATDQNEPS
jgi:hypothetical protein